VAGSRAARCAGHHRRALAALTRGQGAGRVRRAGRGRGLRRGLALRRGRAMASEGGGVGHTAGRGSPSQGRKGRRREEEEESGLTVGGEKAMQADGVEGGSDRCGRGGGGKGKERASRVE
jgi:hypothetical protein